VKEIEVRHWFTASDVWKKIKMVVWKKIKMVFHFTAANGLALAKAAA